MNPKDPTPEEIADACREIQATWTDEERYRRLRADLRPTFQRADGIRETMSAGAYLQHHRFQTELINHEPDHVSWLDVPEVEEQETTDHE